MPGINVRWTVAVGGGVLSGANTTTNASGLASVNWTLGSRVGAQSVTAAVNTEAPTASFFATAVAPIVLHYDGLAWRIALEDSTDMPISLASVWGASPSQIVAVGKCGTTSLALSYDGTTWSKPPASCVGAPLSEYTSVRGTSFTDVFAVARSALPPWFGYSISHYDGQQWSGVYEHSCSFCTVGPRAVWSSSRTDAFTVGDAGEIRRYDGTSWNLLTSGTTSSLNAVWGIGASNAVFAAGENGAIVYFDGSSWHAQTSGTTQPLYAIWGTSANDVFAVGGTGTVLHYDGSAWSAQSSGSGLTLRGVWGTSSSSVFAVGDGSTILYYNGSGWQAHTTSASINLHAVWGSSATNVYAVGTPQ
jgi:hypothetical protein